MHPDVAQKILEETERQYDRIALDFSETRAGLWADFDRIKMLTSPGSTVLDVGCGNGRLYELFQGAEVRYTGVDASARMVEIARGRWRDSGAQFLKASALNLPFPDHSFNVVVLAAVLHHIPGKDLQARVMSEAARVLAPGGVVFITVWNLFQRWYLWYVLRNNFLKLIGGNPLNWNDAMIPWKRGAWVARYCHAFSLFELGLLARKAGLRVRSVSYGDKRRNLILIAEKK